ncbi:GSCOCG00012380001-RA-CDS [Cotesia congregata]|nr:GSCOCG00012380001-RA-CDS [Cotesia congregata]
MILGYSASIFYKSRFICRSSKQSNKSFHYFFFAQDKSVSSKTKKKTSEKTSTISHANHGNDSKQGSDEKPNHSNETEGMKLEHNDEPTEIAEVGMLNFSQDKDQTENESEENTKKIVHENSSQQQSKNEDGTPQTIDETADYNTNLLNDINKYLNDPPTVKVVDRGNIQQQYDVKTKKKSDKVESRHEKLHYVIEQVEEMKKSVENFQQLASTAFQTLLSNWQQFQSTRAAIPSAVKAIDFENIQVPPPVGFIRLDTGMVSLQYN